MSSACYRLLLADENNTIRRRQVLAFSKSAVCTYALVVPGLSLSLTCTHDISRRSALPRLRRDNTLSQAPARARLHWHASIYQTHSNRLLSSLLLCSGATTGNRPKGVCVRCESCNFVVCCEYFEQTKHTRHSEAARRLFLFENNLQLFYKQLHENETITLSPRLTPFSVKLEHAAAGKSICEQLVLRMSRCIRIKVMEMTRTNGMCPGKWTK